MFECIAVYYNIVIIVLKTLCPSNSKSGRGESIFSLRTYACKLLTIPISPTTLNNIILVLNKYVVNKKHVNMPRMCDIQNEVNRV